MRFFYLFFLFFAIVEATLYAEQTDTIIGNASYYADKFHGRTMSNGQLYHRDSMTCAHLSLPFGTLLKVKNPANGQEVIVEVTDRGPFSKKFVLDLSRAAAKKLDLIHRGFAMVEITPYIPECVPFRMPEQTLKIPTLVLQYSPLIVYPDPAWKDESVIAKPAED